MIPEYEKRIAVRVATEKLQSLEQLVQEGKFKDRSSVIRAAIDDLLKEQSSNQPAVSM